jgi:6-phosphogluconolactonase
MKATEATQMANVPPEHWRWQEFPSREALATALATSIGSSLSAAIEERGRALLALSGGTTPRLMFNALSRQAIEWRSVVATLCDERFVPPSSPRSNEGLVERELLQNAAAEAQLIPLFREATSIEAAAAETTVALAALPTPFDVAVLGMGEDGHTASFFPDAEELTAALDPEGTAPLIVIHAASAGEPRLTLTLPTLASAHRVILHIEGAGKREAFERALEGEPALPIRRMIEASANPVEVFWAP